MKKRVCENMCKKLRKSMRSACENSLNKLSIFLSYNSLKKFKEKLDPRKYNGAIFLGLESPLVKSHGSTDAVGFAHSIEVCHKIVKANLIEKIKSHLITVDA